MENFAGVWYLTQFTNIIYALRNTDDHFQYKNLKDYYI